MEQEKYNDCHCHDHSEHKHEHDCDCHDCADDEDDMCDLDPTKVCDNCCKCLDTFNTDEKGYVRINIDKVEKDGLSVEQLYEMYGLDDDDDND